MIELFAAVQAMQASPELSDLHKVAPDIVIDMRYAGENNFIGERIDGYDRAKCLLTEPAANALASAQRELSSMALSLKVHDCFRPQRAVDHFVRWSQNGDTTKKAEYYPNVEKGNLFDLGYIAEKSGHSRGSTIDITIQGLDMGSSYDLFDPLSHTDNERVPAQARANRLLLKLVMEKNGFRNYEKEWWHYTLDDEPYKDQYFDTPIE